MLKPVLHGLQQSVENSSRDGNTRPPCRSRTTCVQVKKQQQEANMVHWTGSKLGKEYIMRNARLDEVKGGIKIVRRNIKSLIYADDTALMKESKEELKSLLMKVKESEKAGLKLNIEKH